jgi:hypothetical protein
MMGRIDGWMDGWKISRKTTTTSFTICKNVQPNYIIGWRNVLNYWILAQQWWIWPEMKQTQKKKKKKSSLRFTNF